MKVNTTITSPDNERLLRPLSSGDIKLVAFQMHPDKAPLPDGLNPTFFQKLWDTIGVDVVASFQILFEQISIPKTVNAIIIVLIPNKDEPKTVMLGICDRCCFVMWFTKSFPIP